LTVDHLSFDDVTRTLTSLLTRRNALRALAGVGFSLGGLRLAEVAGARKKRQRRKKTRKVKPNQFGCLEIGDPCQNADQCCSGICQGKKGKKRCRAHDIGTCDQDRPGYCAEGNPNDAACNGGQGACFRTTSGSNICINNLDCRECQKDADCVALGYPPGAACVQVSGDLACAELCTDETGHMACVYFAATPI
jgi:hypothetical protein